VLASSRPLPVAYLSDMDGVLIDSIASELRAWRTFAASSGIAWTAITAAVAGGGTTRAVVARLAPDRDAAADAITIDSLQIADTAGVVALPGAHDLLTGGNRVAVVTSSSREVAEALMAAAGLRLPDVTVTPRELTGEGKPEPECYLLAAQRLGVSAQRCVAFEDTPGGIEAAVAAGCWVVGITTQHRAADLEAAHEQADSIAAWIQLHGW
jgi:sugar-phosphatase